MGRWRVRRGGSEMNALRDLMRRWLGAVDGTPVGANHPELDLMIQEVEVLKHRVAQLEEERASKTEGAAVRALEARLKLALGQQDITKLVAIAAEAKVDKLAEALGIDVAMFDGQPHIALIKDEGFVKNLREYLAAVRGMEAVLDAEARAARGRSEILRSILKREVKRR